MCFPHAHLKTSTLFNGHRTTRMIASMVSIAPIIDDWFDAHVGRYPNIEQATWLLWTASRAVPVQQFEKGSKPLAPSCASFRPTAEISIQLIKPSLDSMPCCAMRARIVSSLWDLIVTLVHIFQSDVCAN